MSDRPIATIRRTTAETDVGVSLQLSPGPIDIKTGIGFFDHMLTQLAFHAGWSLKVSCKGDLDIDDHHTVEDVGIVLGMAFSKIVPSAKGLTRFGYSYAPMDEALARAVLDISGRSYCVFSGDFSTPSIGLLSTCNIGHFFQSFAANARCTLHLDILRGENDHHKAEALFKAVALAFRAALAPSAASASTKGETCIDSEPA
ncbi:MAG: Imidazoleglycerol-phosphate dehydratase [Spirochaetes bacterium ADurb.Bin110]|nr:MAG: Imidazoleglycerol-phosphate dehydratase [Spirochaetes bacterium ADurb.Bin110]